MSDLPMPEGSFLTSWNEDKMRLPKHQSLPELHLRAIFHPICGCGHCEYDDDGSHNLSAQRVLHASMPRVRYASTPAPVKTRRHRSLIGPHDGSKIQGDAESETTPPTIKGVPYLESTKDRTNSELSRRERIPVATATPALQLGPTLQRPHKQKEVSDSQSQSISDCRDPVFDSTAGLGVRLSSVPSQPSSIDRSHSLSAPMAIVKPSRSLKGFRRNLVVGLDYHDTKKSSLDIDKDHHDIFKEIITDDPYDESRTTPSKRFSPLPPQLRTIRRRKRLSIGRTSSTEPSPVKPIAISLTFSSSPTPQILLPKVSMSALCDRVTYPAEADSESKTTFDAPSSPNPTENAHTQLDASPERRASESLSSRPSTPLSPTTSFHSSVAPANVRLGHPSRPYYSAIRKQGISPPSSRRSSMKDPGPSPTRPKSYSPPSPLPASSKSAPRHLSLSAVPHTSSFVSAFSLDDDSDDNVDEELPIIPLTPVPASGRMSFGTSLAGVAKSLTRKRSKSGPSAFSGRTTTHSKHSHSLSLPPLVFPSAPPSSFPAHHQGNVKGKGFRMSSPSAGTGASGIGFSVSGETELKMALAFSEAHSAENNADDNIDLFATPTIQEEEDTFVPTEPSPPLLSTSLSLSPISPPSSLQLPPISNSRNSIATRVKKLKQGLKDMLLMTTHAPGNNTNSTTTTTTS